MRKFRTRECVVRNSHKGGCCAKISHQIMCCAKFAQGTIHPCKCEIGFFQMAITSLFQIQIENCLKHWTPDFLSFKMTYGMHNLSSRKFSKNVSNSSKMGAAATFPLSFAQSSSNGYNFFVSTPNRAPFEAMDS